MASAGGQLLKLGDRVSFRVKDVYIPGVRELLSSLTEAAEVEGTVIEFSDYSHADAGDIASASNVKRDGSEDVTQHGAVLERFFAVVEVGSTGKAVVPVAALRRVRVEPP